MKTKITAVLTAMALTTGAFANDSRVHNWHVGASQMSIDEETSTSFDYGMNFNWKVANNIYLGVGGDISLYNPVGEGVSTTLSGLFRFLPSVGYKLSDVMLNVEAGYAFGTVGDVATIDGFIYGARAEYYIAKDYPLGVGYQTGTLSYSVVGASTDQDYTRAYAYIGKRF